MSAIFTIVEAQSAYIAQSISGRIDPSPSDMRQGLKQELKSRERPRGENQAAGAELGSHNFNDIKDKGYIKKFSRASRIADRKNPGKRPPRFDAYLDRTWKNLGAMRTAFGKKGKGKYNYKISEPLGFIYKEQIS